MCPVSQYNYILSDLSVWCVFDIRCLHIFTLLDLSGHNNGATHILTVIDTFSKYAWAAKLQSNNKERVVKALELILE